MRKPFVEIDLRDVEIINNLIFAVIEGFEGDEKAPSHIKQKLDGLSKEYLERFYS